ncbi:MAG: hypothetical protein HQL63_10360 [Magnetococcales bacterium]|nr:hypothetical protein [Magnetococcales bacterium]MBF0321888.1 hypothetical protein [Magnetococcales bacterium]
MSVSIAENTRHADLRALFTSFLTAAQTRCFSKVGLAIHGTNRENVLTASAANFTIDSQFYTLAAQAEIDISAISGYTPTVLATGKSRWYLFCLSTASALSVVEGSVVTSSADAVMPDPGTTVCPFCAILVANATGSNFTLGTTALNTANITATYVDLSRPLSGAGAITI